MINRKSGRGAATLNSIRNAFSIIGVLSVLSILISWVMPENEKSETKARSSFVSPDGNLTKPECLALINAYRDRFFKNSPEVPKGFFLSRAAINWVLQNETNNGIYVYPAMNAEGKVCTVFEGGVSPDTEFRMVEGLEGRHVVSESMCPTDCGSLMR